MKFTDLALDKRILVGIKQVGFEEPTPIQEQAVPVALEGKDVLGLAQTGTGKTAAFVLPILQRLSTGSLNRTRALIVTPTRELAQQIDQSIKGLSSKLRVRSMTIYGGVGKGRQIKQLNQGVEIIVACPGRLLDLYSDKKVDLSNIEMLVVDEADRMCDMGFLPDIRRIIKYVPNKRQTLFFSATMPDDIRKLVDEILYKPVTVQVDMIAPAKTVDHAIYPIPQKEKKSLLLEMLKQTATGQVLIFTRTKYRARNLARDLAKRKYKATALQGNMSQNKRDVAISGFRKGKFDIMVATDIAARGIDVANVTHVINFDIPDTVDAYTHRIGRTGRAEQTGEAFTFVDPQDADMVRRIERVLKAPLERKRVAAYDYGGFDPDTAIAEKRQNNNSNGGGSRNGRNRNRRNGRRR